MADPFRGQHAWNSAEKFANNHRAWERIPGFWDIMWWSLKIRWWAGDVAGPQDSPDPDVRIFVRYHTPSENFVLENSVGLQKGMVGVVNTHAGRRNAGLKQCRHRTRVSAHARRHRQIRTRHGAARIPTGLCRARSKAAAPATQSRSHGGTNRYGLRQRRDAKKPKVCSDWCYHSCRDWLGGRLSNIVA